MRTPIHRRGVSLIEALVLIAALATITSLSAALVCRAQRLTTVARDIHAAERDAWRLSGDLRRAAAAAVDARVAGETLTLVGATGVEHAFRFDAEGVTAEQRLSNRRLAGDAYELRGRPTWEVRFNRVARLVEVEARFASETDRARHGATHLHVVAATPRLQANREGAP